MPGPTTEVLNDDLKGLRSDLHGVEVGLRADIARVDKSLGQLAAEFGLLKWLVGASLLASVSGIASSAYWAGSLTSRVGSLEARAEKTDARLTAIENRLGEVDKHLASIDANLVRILERLPSKP